MNPKRIARMCRDGRLLLKRRKGRKRVAVVRIPHLVPTGLKPRWSMDFVHDRFADGRPFRALRRPTVVGTGARSAIRIRIPGWRSLRRPSRGLDSARFPACS